MQRSGHRCFFPARGESLEPARAFCNRCTVRVECYEYALERDPLRNHDELGLSMGSSSTLRTVHLCLFGRRRLFLSRQGFRWFVLSERVDLVSPPPEY